MQPRSVDRRYYPHAARGGTKLRKICYMTLVEVIEVARSSPAKRASYSRIILSIIALVMFFTAAEFWGVQFRAEPHTLVDFDDFYIVGQLVWRGAIEQAYHFATMLQLQKSFSGTNAFMPWTYPPQFDLLLAPLALLPLGVAYSVFMIGTFAAYLATLKRIAAENFVPILILLAPVILITVRCGQNGFLTGALIGLTCLGLETRRSIAGIPLGLMVIKPHLAVAFAVYTLVNRRWGTAFVAAMTVAATSALATVLLGPGVWTAFLDGVKEARVFLEHGFYPFFRMISVYAVVRTFGFPALVATAAQFLVAILALGMVVLASRQFSPRQSLGIAAIATLMISPYAYDYDLLTLGIGLGLLLPDLAGLGTGRERLALYALSLFIGIFSMTQALISSDSHKALGEDTHLSLGGLALVAILVLTWRVLLRTRGRRPGNMEVCAEKHAYVGVNPPSSAPI
jgi:Glycosyltransferase family 87